MFLQWQNQASIASIPSWCWGTPACSSCAPLLSPPACLPTTWLLPVCGQLLLYCTQFCRWASFHFPLGILFPLTCAIQSRPFNKNLLSFCLETTCYPVLCLQLHLWSSNMERVCYLWTIFFSVFNAPVLHGVFHHTTLPHQDSLVKFYMQHPGETDLVFWNVWWLLDCRWIHVGYGLWHLTNKKRWCWTSV